MFDCTCCSIVPRLPSHLLACCIGIFIYTLKFSSFRSSRVSRLRTTFPPHVILPAGQSIDQMKVGRGVSLMDINTFRATQEPEALKKCGAPLTTGENGRYSALDSEHIHVMQTSFFLIRYHFCSRRPHHTLVILFPSPETSRR